jgi:hypothetical protein
LFKNEVGENADLLTRLNEEFKNEISELASAARKLRVSELAAVHLSLDSRRESDNSE